MNRRTVAGLCLVVSPVLHLASSFFWPAGSEGSAAAQLAAAGAHPGAMAAATLLDTAGWVLLLPALAVLWNEVRGRGSALVGVGVWGGVLGVLGFVSGGVLNLATIALAGAHQAPSAYASIKDDGLIAAVVVLPIMLGLLSLVVLLAGAARAGLGGRWMPMAAFVAVVADQLTSESENPLLLCASFLPMAAALVALGLRLLSARTGAQVAGQPVPAAA